MAGFTTTKLHCVLQGAQPRHMEMRTEDGGGRIDTRTHTHTAHTTHTLRMCALMHDRKFNRSKHRK